MITQDKFHKLCKYSIRLEKSFVSNNLNDFSKYCSHLKYHIGNQIGSGSGSGNNQEIDELFDNLTKYITSNSDKYNLSGIKTKFEVIEKALNSQILETQNKLQEANSNENIKIKLEKLRNEKYSEFINLLRELFTKIYNQSVANDIINEIGNGETWKDSEIKKQQRMNEKININGNEKNWNDIIGVIDLINGSQKLKTDIEKYLNTGEGDRNELISQYKTEFNNSTKKLISQKETIN